MPLSTQEQVLNLHRHFWSLPATVVPPASSQCPCRRRSSEELPHSDADRYWLEFVTRVWPKLHSQYGDRDGAPQVFVARPTDPLATDTILPRCGYRWLPYEDDEETSSVASSNEALTTEREGLGCVRKWVCEGSTVATQACSWHKPDWSRVRAVLFYCHGLMSHARLELLAMTVDKSGTPILELNEECLLRRLLRSGILVYSWDHEGHGLSHAWRGSRFNAEAFENIVRGATAWMRFFRDTDGLLADGSVPIFLGGLSMGGLLSYVVGRQLNELVGGSLRGTFMIAPALGFEDVKDSGANRLLMQCGSQLSNWLPCWRLVKMSGSPQYPAVSDRVAQDALWSSHWLPLRLCWSMYIFVETLRKQALSQTLPHGHGDALLIHAQHDTLAACAKSLEMVEAAGYDNVTTRILCDEGWHFLQQEPCGPKVVQWIVEWLRERI